MIKFILHLAVSYRMRIVRLHTYRKLWVPDRLHCVHYILSFYAIIAKEIGVFVKK